MIFIVGNNILSFNSLRINGGSSVTVSMGACGAPDAGSTPAYLPIFFSKNQLWESNEVLCSQNKAQKQVFDVTPAYLPISLTLNTNNYKELNTGDTT